MASQTLVLSKRIISQPTMMPSSSLRSQLLIIDESMIREYVLSIHNYDGRGFNTNFILSMAEKIITLEMGAAQEVMAENLNQLEELDQQLPLHIRRLSFEMAAAANANQHSTTTTLHHVLSILSPYSWEDKLVLMLAAVSIIYGKFSLISRMRKRKGLAQKLAHLKQIPTVPSIVDSISSAIELTKCVVELKQCPSYSPSQSAISALPMATYWIGTSLVNTAASACACDPHFKLQNEVREVTALMANIMSIFSAELAKKKAEESFEALRYAFGHNSSNKSEVFKLMFNVKNDDEKIFCGGTLHRWGRRLTLLLITSGLHVPKEWINFLNWFYRNSKPYIIWIPITQNDASWTTEYEQQFQNLKEVMCFFWLNDAQKRILPQFTRFVKDELFQMRWGDDEPIIVSLDQRGRIVHSNVMHMILTWSPRHIEQNTIGVKGIHNITPFIQKELKQGTSGVDSVVPQIHLMISELVRDIEDKINTWKSNVEDMIRKAREQSTPYDSDREKLLWQQETTWTLHLLAPLHHYDDTIDKPIKDWIDDEKYIFLYGGNDIKWVQEFIFKVREVASKAQLNLELAYIGKNKMIGAIINKEGWSHCPLDNSNKVWWFWTRLRSMFLSRIQYLEMIDHLVKESSSDEILQGLKKLLAYEGKNTRTEGWALLSKGSEVIACGHGSKMLQDMNDYEIWKESIATKSFGQAFKDHHETLSKKNHSCSTLEYPIILNTIPENEKCPECSCCMHKFLTFTCCHGHDIDYDDEDE